jgi:hypothetical protein
MTDASTEKAARERSPSFPFIGLKATLDRLVEFDKVFPRQEPPADRVYLAWGFKGDTSQAQQTLAALKAFGFVDYKGSGPKRGVVLSEDGRTYLRAQQDSEKQKVAKRAALKPKWIAYFWKVWGSNRVPDPVRLDTLVLQHKFNDAAAPRFLKVYDDTIAYAGLSDSDKPAAVDEDPDEPKDELPNIEVGDFIQVEINGKLQLPQAARVRAIQQYDGKPWFYIDGSESGISMEQVRLEQKGVGGGGFVPPPLPLPDPDERAVKPGWKEERLVDDSGEETFLSYKGEPSLARYEFIRDYLDFRIQRLKPKGGVSITLGGEKAK